jgi:hypothetical protein
VITGCSSGTVATCEAFGVGSILGSAAVSKALWSFDEPGQESARLRRPGRSAGGCLYVGSSCRFAVTITVVRAHVFESEVTRLC